MNATPLIDGAASLRLHVGQDVLDILQARMTAVSRLRFAHRLSSLKEVRRGHPARSL